MLNGDRGQAGPTNSGSVCIYIPSYNAARFVRKTVQRIPWDRLPEGQDYQVLFVDNASTDDSWNQIELARRDLKNLGVWSDAILHPLNRGYGGSVKSAFGYALEQQFDIVAVLHSDGQYAPEKMPDLLEDFLAAPRSAMHFGSRLRGAPLRGGMPLYKYLANHFLTWIQNVAVRANLSEYHSGYRLYRMELLRDIPYERNSDGFVFDNEIIFQILKWGFAITESEIPTCYGEEKSNVPILGTPLKILGNLAEYLGHEWGVVRIPRYAREPGKGGR